MRKAEERTTKIHFWNVRLRSKVAGNEPRPLCAAHAGLTDRAAPFLLQRVQPFAVPCVLECCREEPSRRKSEQVLNLFCQQTGDGCSNPNCNTWTQGLFPTISTGGVIANGGVPQNANLSPHLERLAGTVVKWIPDPNWDGNAVLDFEAWTTVWELNNGSGNWHGEKYVNYSIYLEKLKHPSWDDLQVLVEARKEFDAAATNFFVETLNTVKTLRPKAKWGYYGLPMNFFEPCDKNGKEVRCGYDSSLGNLYRSYSDQQKPIWEASTALYPSIYFPPFHTADENAAYVCSMINETLRCAAGKIPVFTFHWNYYHNGTTLLSLEDLQSGLLGPYDMGAGVVMWGSKSELTNDTFINYVTEYVGPMAKNFTESMWQCSLQNCNGNGRCMPSFSKHCECYAGYSGQQCEKKA